MSANVSIYLAGPIDGVSEEDARDWREHVGKLAPVGVLLFSPAHAYFGTSPVVAAELHYLNHQVLQACDAVLAYLPLEKGRALGTIREIEAARMMHKPVAVFGIEAEESLMSYDLMVCHSFEEGLDLILEAMQSRRNVIQQGMMILGPPPPPDE